jgi:hypothetical protein
VKPPEPRQNLIPEPPMEKKPLFEVVEKKITMTDMIQSLFNYEVAQEKSIGKQEILKDHKKPLENNSQLQLCKEDDYIKFHNDKETIGDRKSETINVLKEEPKEEEFLKHQ